MSDIDKILELEPHGADAFVGESPHMSGVESTVVLSSLSRFGLRCGQSTLKVTKFTHCTRILFSGATQMSQWYEATD